jgi:mitochondrial fission protein ELM1
MPPKSLVQWRFLDGRPGHESQVLGLSEALSSLCPSECVDVPISGTERGLRAFFPGQFRHLQRAPRPQLLIGAGHATHTALVRCRQLFGGRSVVLMKPSLPPCLFDLCLVPRHDRLLIPWPNVARTAGAINRMRPADHRPGGRGLVLLGGPSRHFHWSDHRVRVGIEKAIGESAASLQWTVVTSRRTPPSVLSDWKEPPAGIDWQTTGRLSAAEVAALISAAERVVVTSDSMSMICEALTSGAVVEMIELPARRRSRLSVEVRRLVEHGFWRDVPRVIPEADRCASLVLQRLFPEYVRGEAEPAAGHGGRWGQSTVTLATSGASANMQQVFVP